MEFDIRVHGDMICRSVCGFAGILYLRKHITGMYRIRE